MSVHLLDRHTPWLAAVLASCSVVHEPKAPHRVEAEQELARAPGPKPSADLLVAYLPARGIKGYLSFRRVDDGYVLVVWRGVSGGKVAAWSVRYRGGQAAPLDQLIQALKEGALVAARCPKFSVRDEASWHVRMPLGGVEYGLGSPTAGDRACQQLEDTLRLVMEAGQLACSRGVCLALEEMATGHWSCVDGVEGQECRDGKDALRR